MVAFTPMEEREIIPLSSLEEEKDFFREGRVGTPSTKILVVVLEVVVQVFHMVEGLVAGEGTLGGVVETMKTTLVGEGEDLITMERVKRMNVVITQLDMAR